MSNNIQSAPAAQTETFSSSELTTQVAEAKSRRAEMTTETEKVRVELAEKRAAIRLFKPKSLDEATTAQARFTVLTDAGTALDEEISQLEGALQTQLAKEQRALDLEELASLKAQLEDEKAGLKTQSLDAATALQTALDGISAGQRRADVLANQVHWKREALGQANGFADATYSFADGHLASHLSESGQVETVIIQEFVAAHQRLRQSRHIDEHGITLWNTPQPNFGEAKAESNADQSPLIPTQAPQPAQAVGLHHQRGTRPSARRSSARRSRRAQASNLRCSGCTNRPGAHSSGCSRRHASGSHSERHPHVS